MPPPLPQSHTRALIAQRSPATIDSVIPLRCYNVTVDGRGRPPGKAYTSVKWFRNNIRTGSRLALFALAIQFALSFGHFHASAAPAIATGLTQADLAYIGTAAAPDAVREAARQQQPAIPDTDQQPADACAICAVIALAGHLADIAGGYETRMYDVSAAAVDKGRAAIEQIVRKGVELGKTTAADAGAMVKRLSVSESICIANTTSEAVRALPVCGTA